MAEDTAGDVEFLFPFIRVGSHVINTDAIRNAIIDEDRIEVYFTDGTRSVFERDEAKMLMSFFGVACIDLTPLPPTPPVAPAVSVAPAVVETPPPVEAPVVLPIAPEPVQEPVSAPTPEPAADADPAEAA